MFTKRIRKDLGKEARPTLYKIFEYEDVKDLEH